jgi:hypothetical protein
MNFPEIIRLAVKHHMKIEFADDAVFEEGTGMMELFDANKDDPVEAFAELVKAVSTAAGR